MMKKTYLGSCHCGKVRFEADIDLSAGTGRCNCSICTKQRAWGVTIKPEDFRLIEGEGEMSDYQFGTKSGHHRFCKTCGVRPYGDGYVEEMGGAFVGINLAALDNVDVNDLIAAPIHYSNGRDNLWWETPQETRHL